MADVTLKFGDIEDYSEARVQDLQGLAQELAEVSLQSEIEYKPKFADAITMWEATEVYLGTQLLDAATGNIAGRVVDAVVGAAVRWAKKKLARNKMSMPQLINIYGPDGRVIK